MIEEAEKEGLISPGEQPILLVNRFVLYKVFVD
jgi:hypothetical protein